MVGPGLLSTADHGLRTTKKVLIENAIEYTDTLGWKKWQPGAEHVKHILVRNICPDVIKIKYGLPSTKYFRMDFPEPIKLSPGMSASIPVTFCPTRAMPYQDRVTFQWARGEFTVSLRGLMPEVDLEVPPLVDFGYSPCLERRSHRVSIRNVGRAPVDFAWTVPAPFAVEPAQGSVPVNSEAVLTCSFLPTSASVFTASAVCNITGGPSITMRMQGIGKYAFLRLDADRVNFGEVLPNSVEERIVTLHNLSAVEAKFEVTGDGDPEQSPFAIVPASATIPPSSSAPLRVRYSPTTADSAISEVFSVVAVGGNTLTLTAKGACVGPEVSLSTQILNFGSVQAGKRAKRAFMIYNRARVDVAFQFTCEGAGAFELDAVRGVLPALGSTLVNATFTPEVPAQYRRRVFLLVMSASEVTALDLIGTCFTADQHPDPLQEWHLHQHPPAIAPTLPSQALLTGGDAVEAATPRVSRWVGDGGGTFAAPTLGPEGSPQSTLAARRATLGSPGQESAMLREAVEMADMASLADSRLGSWGQMLAQAQREGLRAGAGAAQAPAAVDRSPWRELFSMTQRTPDGGLSVDAGALDFGACSRLRLAPNKTVTVTNHTKERLVVHWATTAAEADVDPKGRVFPVFPNQAEVGPSQSAQFRVSFRPKRDNAYYAAQLECFAVRKAATHSSLETGRARNAEQLAAQPVPLPWALVVDAVGHTFQGAQESLPMVAMSAQQVEFPAGYVGSSSSQVVSLFNQGATPVTFEASVTAGADDAGIDAPFAVYPSCGVVPPASRQLLALRFSAKEARVFAGKLKVLVNGHGAQSVALRGVGCRPALRLGDSGTLFLKPTCAGASSTCLLPCRNPTPVPVAFQWEIPEAAKSLLRVSPEAGVIPGGESLSVEWTFAPRKAKAYSLAVPVHMGPPNGSHFAASRGVSDVAVLRVVGEGTAGGVAVTSGPLQAGVVRIGDVGKVAATVVNQSQGVLQFLLVPYRVRHDGTEEIETSGQLTLPQPRGTLAALTEHKIPVDFAPRRRALFHFRVKVFAMGGGSASAAPLVPEAIDPADPTGLGLPCAAQFDVMGSGQHPMLQIVDVASSLQKSVVWDMSQAAEINQAFGAAMTIDELHRVEALAMGKTSVTDVMRQLTPIPVDLPCGAPGAEDAVLHLLLRNVSDLDADWSISLPNETDLDMESWVLPRFPPDAVAQMEHLFEVHPRSGKVAPGAEQQVTLRFRHEAPAVHRLPLLMYIAHGKCLSLEIVGRTLEPDAALMASGDVHHELVAVEVGRPEPPLQTVTLYNRGPAPVQFELDTAALQDLRAACWDFEVLKLLSPSQGTIPARGHLVTWWSFSPLEAKEYAVTVPVRVDGEPSHNLVVTARGVAPTHVPGRWDAMAEAEGLIAGHRPPPGSLGLLSGEVDPFSGRGAEADAPMPSGDAAGDTGRSRAAGPSAGAEASAAGSPGAARERERERESGPAEMPRALLRTATARPGTKDGLRGPETLGLDERTGENMGSVDLPLFARLRDRASHVALSQDVLDMGSVACAETRCSVLLVHNRHAHPIRFKWALGDYEKAKGRDAGHFDGSLSIEPMEGALKPGERCLVKFEVRGGGRAVLFDGCVVLTTEEQQDSVSPRDVARWTMERTQGGRAVAEEAAKALRMRPGVTGFVANELSLDAITSVDSANNELDLNAIQKHRERQQQQAPPPPQVRPLRVIGEVHTGEPLLPHLAVLRRLAVREMEEARRSLWGGRDPEQATGADDDGMMASIVGSVLESALEALACDPTVFVAALVPQPDIPARQAGRRNAMPASVEAGVGDEEARRALAEAEGRVVDLEAEMFAEYLLESAIFSVLQESVAPAAQRAAAHATSTFEPFRPSLVKPGGF